MPPGYGGRLAGQTQILDETTANLMMAIGLASIFVYMVLAAQFESFVQPIIIMLVLPVSVPFALFTLWATGRTLNLWSALGILLLFGIVKKNSILQVDYANVLRARGMPVDEAIVEACRTRLRPDSDDDVGDHRRAAPDGARARHRRRAALGHRRHDHRRPVAVPASDAAARPGRVREARRGSKSRCANQRFKAWMSRLRVWTAPSRNWRPAVSGTRINPEARIQSSRSRAHPERL